MFMKNILKNKTSDDDDDKDIYKKKVLEHESDPGHYSKTKCIES